MPTKTSNWTKFKVPGAALDTFTRHEPFPSSELKDTYIDGMSRPRKKNRKRNAMAEALERRWTGGM